MSVTLNIVVATADQPRLQAALAGSGIANPAQLITDRINQIVQSFEAQQASDQAMGVFQGAMDAHAEAFVPITPQVTVTPGP